MKKKNSGNGGGRKPLPKGEKKVPITTYVNESKVNEVGKEKIKEIVAATVAAIKP